MGKMVENCPGDKFRGGVNAPSTHEIINEENSEKEKMIRELGKWSQAVVKIIEKEKDGI